MKYLIALLLFASPAFALTVDAPMQLALQEERAQALFHELRCVVCQGEAIADSPADVARDMRMTVREQIAQGKSDDEVMDYFVHQYGERVRMMPTLSRGNFILWFSPFFVLLLGAWIVWRGLFAGRK